MNRRYIRAVNVNTLGIYGMLSVLIDVEGKS